jgi:hypothetical protein
MAYQYALDAARLLERCRSELDDVIREAFSRGDARFTRSPARSLRASPLLSLEEALAETDRLLLGLLISLLEHEKAACIGSKRIQQLCAFSSTATLSANVDLLVSVLQIKRKEAIHDGGIQQDTGNKHCFCPERSASDSLLFRLIVALQLCSIRINDAFLVVSGRRKERKEKSNASAYPNLVMVSTAATCSLGLLANNYLRGVPFARSREMSSVQRSVAAFSLLSVSADSPVVLNLARLGLAFVSINVARGIWNNVWMRNQLSKSRKAIVEWNRQWRVIQSTTSSWGDIPNASELSQANLLQAKQTQKLIEYTLREPSKVREPGSNDPCAVSELLLAHSM